MIFIILNCSLGSVYELLINSGQIWWGKCWTRGHGR